MREQHWCECGYEFAREFEPGPYRWQCPRCRCIYTILAPLENPPNRTTAAFQEAIRRVEGLDAEGAVDSFAQFYEFWIKCILRVRDQRWAEERPLADVAGILRQLESIYDLPAKALRGIDGRSRNLGTHEPAYATKTAGAVAYGEGVVAATWETLMLLVGESVWKRGAAGELDEVDSDSSDEHFAAAYRYHLHWRLGIVGPVMWTRTWWKAYRAGRADWHKAEWTGSPDP